MSLTMCYYEIGPSINKLMKGQIVMTFSFSRFPHRAFCEGSRFDNHGY